MFRFINSKYFPFWLMSLTILSALILPVLVMEGIFMDGLLYSTVSKNLADGYGSMWFLKYSHYGFAEHPTFHEHPPLIFWVQSLFFKLFGDGMWVERLYSYTTAIVGAWLIMKNWQVLFPKHFKTTAWLPILLWIIIPVGFWSYQNNMHENTLAIFALASVYFILKAVHLNEKVWVNLSWGAIMIFCAGFAKGIPGLFTLGVIFFHWVIFRKQSFIVMCLQSLFLLLIPTILLVGILQIPEAKDSLSIYFYDRLLGRIDGAHTADSHFFILIRLIQEILPSFILVGITLLILKWRKVQLNLQKSHLKWSMFFFLVGLSGSIPLMLTLVQKTFYFVGSLPFFGLSFACLLAPSIQPLLENIKTKSVGLKIFRSVSILSFVGVIILTVINYGKVNRGGFVVDDLQKMEEHLSPYSIVSFHPKMAQDWNFRLSLMRYHKVSVESPFKIDQAYYIFDNTIQDTVPSYYKKLALDTEQFDLYQRVEK